MTAGPILYDTHMHTPLCKHAVGEPEEYAAVAEKRGLAGITVTCHNPAPGWSPKVRMDEEQFDEYVDLVDRARREWAGRVDVLLGLESDFVPGMESWLEDLHARAPLNYVLGSVHTHLPQYRKRYYRGDSREFQRTYFEHLALAAETRLVDSLAHPDLVKNDDPEAWEPGEILDDIRRALDRVAATRTAMELNTSGLQKRVREMNPCPAILHEMRARDIPVVIGSDAHRPDRVAADFEQALDLLEKVGYEEIRYYVERDAVHVKIHKARASLR